MHLGLSQYEELAASNYSEVFVLKGDFIKVYNLSRFD